MDEEEYIKLILDYYASQGNSDELLEYDNCDEPDDLTKESLRVYRQIINFTNKNIKYIEDNIHNFQNYRIGNFLIKIKKYSASPLTIVIDIDIFEEIECAAYNSESGRIIQKIKVIDDDRFKNQHWCMYFNKYNTGIRIPNDILIEIIKWCQALNKMKVFL